MELAAGVGDTWPFRRISEELAHSRFSGEQPWDALHHLADELAITDLDDLADIMRLCGEEGAPVYDTLRARSAATRNALLSADLTRSQRRRRTHVHPRQPHRRGVPGHPHRARDSPPASPPDWKDPAMTTLAQAVAAYCSALIVTTRRRMVTVQRDERGSTTIQEVLWAIAAIAFVASWSPPSTRSSTARSHKIH